MSKMSTLNGIYTFYRDGFRHMTPLGRTLWLIIAIKLLIIFAILKVFFFPDYLKKMAPDGDKAGYVSTQLTERAAGDKQ